MKLINKLIYIVIKLDLIKIRRIVIKPDPTDKPETFLFNSLPDLNLKLTYIEVYSTQPNWFDRSKYNLKDW